MPPDAAPPRPLLERDWQAWQACRGPAPTLGHDEVHNWRVLLDRPGLTPLESLVRLLSADERDRTARFHFDRDRARFIACRGVLRSVLARYLGTDPAQLRFAYGAYGKPELETDRGATHLRFNLSHSAGLALVALARGRRIGVDVEAVRPIHEVDALADRFLSAAERAALRELPRSQRSEAFLRMWTRKEAALKATGGGLAALEATAPVPPDAPAADHPAAPIADLSVGWFAEELNSVDGYVGALVIEGDRPVLRFPVWADGIG